MTLRLIANFKPSIGLQFKSRICALELSRELIKLCYTLAGIPLSAFIRSIQASLLYCTYIIFDNVVLSEYVAKLPVCDFLSMMQHNHSIGQPPDCLHDVLDHND